MNCVFLDRDGTLIRHIPYLCDLRQVQLLPTVVSGLGELLKADCRLFLHTNQSGIGRGYFSLREALACNSEMIRQIGLGPDLFAGVCLCPEAPGQPIEYRKPSPKYAREVMITYATDVRRLCYIGDNITDLMTAREVGCAAVGVDTGGHELRRLALEHEMSDFPVVDSFLEAATCALRHFGRPHGYV
jgi:D-glycero-D-manno-heptose 1,7-bisphosphate phosphatase